MIEIDTNILLLFFCYDSRAFCIRSIESLIFLAPFLIKNTQKHVLFTLKVLTSIEAVYVICLLPGSVQITANSKSTKLF